MITAPRPVYPASLEAWWLAAARRHLAVPHNTAALRALDAEVAKLSDGFTTGRDAGIGDYAADEKSLLAYGLFYFPQTFVRTLFQFDEIVRRCDWSGPGDGPLRIADLGAGAGSAGFAIASRLARERDVELLAVEKSAASLGMLERIAADNQAMWPRLKTKTRCGDIAEFPATCDTKFDIVVASFALNENFRGADETAFATWAGRALALLSPGGLLLISEPAMKFTSERLERLRDRVAAEGKMTVLAPCLHQRPCPMLAARGEEFCHEVRWWKPPPSLQSLNSRLFRTIQFLKSSFVAIANIPPLAIERSDGHARLVSPMMSLKGRVQCDGCAHDGAIRRYELLTRNLEAPEKYALLQAERGDVIGWRNLALLGDKQTHRAETAERQFCFERQTDGGRPVSAR